MFLGLQKPGPKGLSQSLKYSKGYAMVSPSIKKTAADAIERLIAQNSALSKDIMVELTYGPKRCYVESFVPDYVKLDNRILCFEGVIRDEIQDWWTEKNRIHFVKVLYYLENDTMKIVEPQVLNSGLCQGTLFQRDRYKHLSCGRNYHWKDLNIGRDIRLFGRTIHLYDCDIWTRQFLTEQGIEVNNPECRPENPILLERAAMMPRQELRHVPVEDRYPHSQFYKYHGKVLRYYGIYKNDLESPMAIRRIVLNFYLSDNTLEVIENWKPSGGRGPPLPTSKDAFDAAPNNVGFGSWQTIIKRQKVLLDRNKDIGKLPCYLEPLEEDDLTWMTPIHFKTGEDVKILGKTFYLNKCNEFTTHFYRDNYGIEMQQVDLMVKTKPDMPMLIPPADLDVGPWSDTFEDCFKPHAKKNRLVEKSKKKSFKPRDLDETVLRFSAILDTPRETEQCRSFIISYFMEDDSVKIIEERVDNSGFPGGVFMGRCRLRKDLAKIPELTPSLVRGAKPQYYEAADFYIGARIRANGSLFLIKDSDLRVFQFMEDHPEIYPDIDPKEQKALSEYVKGFIRPSYHDRMLLLQKLEEEVLQNYGSSIFPYPKTLSQNLGTNFQLRKTVEEVLYSSSLPISRKTLRMLLDAYTFKEKVDVKEVKAFLNVALGHDRCH